MTVLEDICRVLLEGREVKEPNPGSTRRRQLCGKIWAVEYRMFQLYLQTGKGSKNKFPFNRLGKLPHTKEAEAVKIAETLFNVGWSPEKHVSMTRERFEKIEYIGRGLMF